MIAIAKTASEKKMTRSNAAALAASPSSTGAAESPSSAVTTRMMAAPSGRRKLGSAERRRRIPVGADAPHPPEASPPSDAYHPLPVRDGSGGSGTINDISKMLNQAGAGGTADPAAALGGLSQAIQGAGGIDGILDKLRAGGLGGEVNSWVSTGANQPVAPEALGQALGPDTVQELSSGSGIEIGQLLPMLAAFLPQIVNTLDARWERAVGRPQRRGRRDAGPRRLARRPDRWHGIRIVGHRERARRAARRQGPLTATGDGQPGRSTAVGTR